MTEIARVPSNGQSLHVVYLPPGSTPDAAQVPGIAAAWIAAHTEEPLRGLLLSLIQQGATGMNLAPATALPPVPYELLAHIGMTEIDERHLRAATAAALVSAVGRPVHPFPALWLSGATALALAGAGGGVVFEPPTMRILTEELWARRAAGNGAIAARHHPIVPTSIGLDGLGLLTTRGLEAFGLPELRLTAVPPHLAVPAGHLVNGAAQAVIELMATAAPGGAVSLAGDLLLVDTGHLARSGVPTWPPEPGERGVTVGVALRPARAEEPAWLDLGPPMAGRPPGEWLSEALTGLLGVDQEVVTIPGGSDAMQAAHERAFTELPALAERFARGLPTGSVCYVKKGFITASGSHEFIWLSVARWAEGWIRASVAGEPTDVPGLHAGQEIDFPQSDVFDWMIEHSDGVREGDYTSAVLRAGG